MTASAASPWVAKGVSTQLRVIGAVIIRELHTRFGRENIGYLWFIVEPMLLASGITLAHLFSHFNLPAGMQDAPFTITGYCTYMVFRGTVNRAPATIESNRGLLYHRQVTLLDLVLARCLLEIAAVMAAMLILLGLAAALGLGRLPERPLLMLGGMALMFWFTFALSMIVCAASERSVTVERLVHPITYLSIPISGMFFLIDWIPATLRPYVLLFPLPHIIELVREGQFGDFDSPYVDVPYVISWCAGLTLLGLLALRVARRRLEL